MDLETRARLARRADELEIHWAVKGRGVEVAAAAGWYFTGRTTALRDLTGWISQPADDPRMRVVTGDPGSGKSAVLGRLVLLWIAPGLMEGLIQRKDADHARFEEVPR